MRLRNFFVNPYSAKRDYSRFYSVLSAVRITATLRIMCLTLSSLSLPLSSHPLKAANCCRNSRLVEDEDELMWVKN